MTRMLRDGVPEQRIKWMVGWGPDSSQFERYGHLTDEDHILAHAKDHGYEVEVPEIGKQSLDECPKCGYGFLIHDPLACPSCGLSLSHNAEVVAQAHEAAEAAKDRVTERTMDETDPKAIKGAKAILETLGDEDTVLEVAEILQYLTDDETDLTRLAERAEATADADK